MNISLRSPQTARRSSYAVAGRQLRVEASDEWSAQLFNRFFAGWNFATTDIRPASKSSFTIKIYTGTTPPPVPSSLEWFETKPGELCYSDGRTYFLASNSSAILVHPPAASCLEVWIGDAEEDKDPSALDRLVFNTIGAALRRCGLFELHSGGVVEPETGAGVLFVGASGSGKSTTTIRLAAAGWRYLSDDLLLLTEGHEGIRARGLRRFFAATENTIAASHLALGKGVRLTAAPSKPHKQRFEPEHLFPLGFIEDCLPRALFFMSIIPQWESRCEELTQDEVMTRLLKMYPWACYDRPVAPQYLRVLSRLARQCVSFDLFAGRNLLNDPACAPQLIASCVRRSVK